MGKKNDIPYIIFRANGRINYKRRVPKNLHTLVGKDMWEYSLGREPDAAYRRGYALRDEHDALISELSTGDGRSKAEREGLLEFAADFVETAFDRSNDQTAHRYPKAKEYRDRWHWTRSRQQAHLSGHRTGY